MFRVEQTRQVPGDTSYPARTSKRQVEFSPKLWGIRMTGSGSGAFFPATARSLRRQTTWSSRASLVNPKRGLLALSADGHARPLTELEGDFRNDVIGMLVTHAMYDGLSGALGPNPGAIKKICWRATGFPDRPTNLPSGGDDTVNADIVPELGIIKQYKGELAQDLIGAQRRR